MSGQEPVDGPEGMAVVLVSATLFKEWANQRGATIAWGEPRPWQGMIYEPVIRSAAASGDALRAETKP